MPQPELARMERDHARCVALLAAGSVEAIGNDRMSDARKMGADLMRPAGFEGQLQKRALAGAVDPLVVRDRVLAALVERDDRAAVVTGWIAAERRVDRAGISID